MNKIGDLFQCSNVTISRHMEKNNWKRRTNSESHTGIKLSKKHKISISKALKGKKKTEEHRKNISKGQKRLQIGEKNHNYGKRRKESTNWKGGKSNRPNGYVYIHKPEHPNANGQYIFEHRLIMEDYLGRYLKEEEVVHHKNGDVSDNRIENLKLFATGGEHTSYHHKRGDFDHIYNK